jgi:hypothetical protein
MTSPSRGWGGGFHSETIFDDRPLNITSAAFLMRTPGVDRPGASDRIALLAAQSM